ncbi:MAG TPA: hypothetical protein VIC08_10280, partial [Cellvibrionaceae bacterium]
MKSLIAVMAFFILAACSGQSTTETTHPTPSLTVIPHPSQVALGSETLTIKGPVQVVAAADTTSEQALLRLLHDLDLDTTESTESTRTLIT